MDIEQRKNILRLLEDSGPEEMERIMKEYSLSGVLDSSKIKARAEVLNGYFYRLTRAVKAGELPQQGSPSRDIYLDKFWKDEPILAGAVYSMSAKMTALPWSVKGKGRKARQVSMMLAKSLSMSGSDWGSFISATAQDFFTTDRGAHWEVIRGNNDEFLGYGHIDALCCFPTGLARTPIFYQSVATGQTLYMDYRTVKRFASLPSAREELLGTGFCAVSRAHKAAKILLMIYEYDEERLNNLPPEGIAAISGLTDDEFRDSLTLWEVARKQNNNLTYPQVLWLLSSTPGAEIKIETESFSKLPESFDKETVITQYVNTLALDFGVDAREFWPISTSSMGTAAESQIQHMKARGKGFGEFISISERQLNSELEEVEFEYDLQDMDEDKTASEVAKEWIGALLPLTQLSPEDNKPYITKVEFMRLLADKGIIPNHMVRDDRAVVFDSKINLKEEPLFGDFTDDPVIARYDNGRLKIERDSVTVYGVGSRMSQNGHKIAVQQKENQIRGNPLPEDEELTDTEILASEVLTENKRWAFLDVEELNEEIAEDKLPEA